MDLPASVGGARLVRCAHDRGADGSPGTPQSARPGWGGSPQEDHRPRRLLRLRLGESRSRMRFPGSSSA
jgi:hypothetical protein